MCRWVNELILFSLCYTSKIKIIFFFNRQLIVGYPRLIAIKKINHPAALLVIVVILNTMSLVYTGLTVDSD